MAFKYNDNFKDGYYKVSFKAFDGFWHWEGEAENREDAYWKGIEYAENTYRVIPFAPKPWEMSNLKISKVEAPSYGRIENWQFVAGISWLIILAMLISQFL
ncbi:hypothetical protein [Enterococcus phage vB_EfaS_Ef7.1]|nr:hypothetical protein [Enterococcus phage vB_EfaS_Ef7.1]